MITIDHYTGNWQMALNPTPPKLGSLVRIHDEPDAREYDDFEDCLELYKLEAEEFVRYMPRLRMNVYKIGRRRDY